MKYTIWLVPQGQAFDQLKQVVIDLATEHQAPTFTPHVTLIGDVEKEEAEMVELTTRLVQGLQPMSLETGAVDYSTTYFQCVFVRIKNQPQLLEAYLKAVEMFSLPDRFYMPHISLVYGNFSMEKRQTIAEQIQLPSLRFQPKVQLVVSDPDPANWDLIKEFELI